MSIPTSAAFGRIVCPTVEETEYRQEPVERMVPAWKWFYENHARVALKAAAAQLGQAGGGGMMATIKRTYTFSRDDVRNALCEWLKKRDIPAPKYVGDTDCTTWETLGDGSQTVEWNEELEPRY